MTNAHSSTRSAEGDPWLRRFATDRDAPHQLVCFPHAGGAVTFFSPLARALSGRFEVCGVQYPGRQDRRAEPCLRTIAEIADGAFTALRSSGAAPRVLFGHSMGAVVAFEVARRMEEHGTTPLGLVVSGRRAPSTIREEAVHRRGDNALVDEIRRLGGTDTAFLDDPELRAMVLPAIRADYTAVETYRYVQGSPLSCGIAAIIGTGDPRVTQAEAEAWSAHTSGDFTLQTVPGGHFYLRDHVDAFLGALLPCLSAFTGEPVAPPSP
jgi:surfactin synthase thioesterase subunit